MRRGRIGLAAGLATFVTTALPCGELRAQDPPAQRRELHDGVDRAIQDLSGSGDASSIELNPALLNGVLGLDITLLGYQTLYDFARGAGFGAFASVNLNLGFALGFGVQAIEPAFRDGNFDDDANHNRPGTKFSFALAGGRAQWGSFGLGVHGLWRSGERLRPPQLDLGTAIRITNYASFGAVARLAPADLRDDRFRPILDLAGELSVRPLGTRWLEFAGGLTTRVDQTGRRGFSSFTTDDLLPYGRLAVRWQGIEVAGQIQRIQTDILDEDTLAIVAAGTALRGGVSVTLAFDYASVGVGVHAGLGDGVDGIAYKARFSTLRQGRVVWTRPVDAEKLELAKVDDQRSLIALLRRIEAAEAAGERAILVVAADDFGLGWGAGQELREALKRVRNAGGHVYAWVESPGLRDYWLASVAEKIYTHPAGEFATVGIGSRRLYFRDALAKLGVEVEVARIDEFKSAYENLTRSDRSPEDRKQRELLLDDTWKTVVYDIAQARGLAQAEVRKQVAAAPLGPTQAVQAGLADEVMHRDELSEALSEELGTEVSLRRFAPRDPEGETWSVAPYQAVVLIEGTIVDGRSRTIPLLGITMTGGDTTVALLRELRSDPACKGIVVRVDSGGGSAFASELIWREVERTHAAWEKDPRGSPPIVVSMSDIAASGGYYLAMGANFVLAQPLTVTGSIGVVFLHFDISGLMAKLGVGLDRIERGGEGVDINAIFEPWSPAQREKIDAGIARTYDMFLERVAAGRGMDKKAVNAIGRGRVWSGERAKQAGLIDAHGGLREALAELRKRGQVRDFRKLELRVLPRRPTLLQLILRGAGSLIAAPVERSLDARAAEARSQLPPVIDSAVARLPLSILFLPQDAASTVVPGEVELE